MNLHKKLLWTAGAALLLSSTALLAANDSARDILNNAYQHIGSMNKYSFTAVTDDGTYKNTANVKVERPGKLRVDVKGTVRDRSIYLNNGIFTMMDHNFNYYGSIKTPSNINDALDVLFEEFGIRAPLAQLVYSDMHKKVKFKSSKRFGTREIAGVECDYVAFKNGTKELHVWITVGDVPFVKAYSLIDTDASSPSRADTVISWNDSQSIEDSDFVFADPRGSSKISVTKPQ